jgi:hypothetical protein
MTNHHCILGLIFDQRLNWKEHIKNLKPRAMKKLNIIKSLAHMKWGAEQQTLLRINKLIILPTLRYGKTSASPTPLKSRDPVQHKGVRLALGTFVVCRTKNVLHEDGTSTLADLRKQDTVKKVIRVSKVTQ